MLAVLAFFGIKIASGFEIKDRHWDKVPGGGNFPQMVEPVLDKYISWDEYIEKTQKPETELTADNCIRDLKTNEITWCDK